MVIYQDYGAIIKIKQAQTRGAYYDIKFDKRVIRLFSDSLYQIGDTVIITSKQEWR